MKKSAKFSSSEIELTLTELDGGKEESCPSLHSLIVVESGQGELAVEGGIVSVAAGDVILTRPLAYRRICSSENINYISLLFLPEMICPEGDPISRVLDFEGHARIYRDARAAVLLPRILEGLQLADELDEPFKHQYSLSVVRQALTALCSLSGEGMISAEDELGARICEYINENLREDLSLEKIARAFFISKFYLCRAFKEYIGSSIHGYIVAKRISLAKGLIDSGESASSVAYKVGFGDYSAFYRAYVKHVGRAPTQK